MRPLRYSINVTLDGCCDHRAITPNADLHRHSAESLDQGDAHLFGRVTYEMMEAAFRPPVQGGAMPDWMEPFARTIDAPKKYVLAPGFWLLALSSICVGTNDCFFRLVKHFVLVAAR